MRAAVLALIVLSMCGCRGQPPPAERRLGQQEAWVASARHLGPVRVGMTPEEVEIALGVPLVGSGSPDECVYTRAETGPEGVLFMVVGGRIVRIDVTAPGVATEDGIEVGDTEMRAREIYGGRVTPSPHKYTDGRYLTVAPDATHRIVFETDGQRVTRYRIGQLPQVEWVEGCA